MMTKTQFANKIIDDFCRDNNLVRNGINNWSAYLHTSSRLCVALEYLGLISEKDLEYTSQRGGIEYICVYDKHMEHLPLLSTRELMDLLPDDKNTVIKFSIGSISMKDLLDILESKIQEYSCSKDLSNFAVSIEGIKDISIMINFSDDKIDIRPIDY